MKQDIHQIIFSVRLLCLQRLQNSLDVLEFLNRVPGKKGALEVPIFPERSMRRSYRHVYQICRCRSCTLKSFRGLCLNGWPEVTRSH